jgi:hypothetical protein
VKRLDIYQISPGNIALFKQISEAGKPQPFFVGIRIASNPGIFDAPVDYVRSLLSKFTVNMLTIGG